MLLPKFTLKDIPIGSGDIIGKDNIGEFFNYVSKHEIEDRSLAELAPDYETAAASLVCMLEARFVNLNPIIQQMFLNLDNIKDIEKRKFILETLFNEFGDVAIEARKVFDRFKMLGSCVDVSSTLGKANDEETKIPIPFKLVGMHEALEKNFDWIVPANPFDESSMPKRVEKGTSKTSIDEIQFIVEEISRLNFDNT